MNASFKRFVINFFIALAAIGFIIACYSCSPQNRLQRILNKHPYLLTRLDTVIFDTVIHNGFKYDTLVSFKKFDTIIINKNGLETKIYRYFNTDSIFIYQKLKSDTIVKTITTKAKVITVKEKPDTPQMVFIAFVLMCLIIGVINLKSGKK